MQTLSSQSNTRERRRGPLLVTAALLLAAAAVWFIFQQYLPLFVTAETLLEGVPSGRSTRKPGEVAGGRVVVVIVDGLGHAFARDLPEYDWLWQSGTARPLRVEYPSYTSPALLGFVTGLGPRDSGLRLNADPQPIIGDLDTLTEIARDRSRPIRFYGGGWGPFGPLMKARAGEIRRHSVATAAAPFLAHSGIVGKDDPGRLVFAYYGAVDAAGHRHGAASAEYLAASQRSAAYVARHAATLDFSEDYLVVLSDHGHLPEGGHGGDEAVILNALFAIRGPHIQAAAELEARPLVDVAATLALLAGLVTPADSLGRPMLDMLNWPRARKARAFAPAFEQGLDLLCQLDRDPRCVGRGRLSDRLAASDHNAFDEADALFASMQQARSQRLQAQAEDQRRSRFLWVCGAMLCALLALFGLATAEQRRAWRERLRQPTTFAPLLLVGVYLAAVWLRGYRLSFSRMTTYSLFTIDVLAASAVAGVVVAAVFSWVRSDRLQRSWLLLVPWLLLLPLIGYVGLDPRWVPTPRLGLLLLLLCPLPVAAGVAVILLTAMQPWRRRQRSGTL